MNSLVTLQPLVLMWVCIAIKGTNAAAKIFQYTLQTALEGLEGVKNIANDMIVFGSTRAEHDTNLNKCLQRLAVKGLRLNQSKCDFLSGTLSFFGRVFSEEGTRPDPQRVTDLSNAPQPNNAHDVRSLLGMANYSSKYIREFATFTAPLRELTKKDVRFEWTQKHQAAFEKLKTNLVTAPCMSYFDKNNETFIVVDTSPVGISAILSPKPENSDTDNQQIIAYASRALTDTEKRYSQTERDISDSLGCRTFSSILIRKRIYLSNWSQIPGNYIWTAQSQNICTHRTMGTSPSAVCIQNNLQVGYEQPCELSFSSSYQRR